MFKRMREKRIIKDIRKHLQSEGLFKYIALNSIQQNAVHLLLNDKITVDFYQNVFMTRDGKHYTERNAEYINNYK